MEGLRVGAQAMGAAGPRLAISRNGAELTFSWPVSAEGYKLFSNLALQSSGWTAVNDPVVVAGDQNTVRISTAEPIRFFRLQR